MTINVGNREEIIVVKETTRGTIGNFASDGFYIGVETILSDFNENVRSMKSRTPVNGGMQRDVTMDDGVNLLKFNMSYKLTDFRHMRFMLADNTEAGSNPYTHTFTLANSTTFNFFSLQRIFNGGETNHTYLGCAILNTKYEWQKSTGDDEAGYVKVTNSCVATSFDDEVSKKTVPDSTTKTIFTFNEFKVTIGGSVKATAISGSIEIDSGVNPEDFFYCDATNNNQIGEVIPIFYKTVGNLTFNIIDNSLVDEMQEDGISGTNKFELIKNATNDKIEFNFSSLYNLQPFAPTNYKAINQVGVVYDATINNIIVTDEFQNY